MEFYWYGSRGSGINRSSHHRSGKTFRDLLETMDVAMKEKQDGALEVINNNRKEGEARSLWIEIDGEPPLFCPTKSGPGPDHFYYNNFDCKDEYVEMGAGDVADIFVTDDFDLIMKMIEEFWQTGDVKEIKYLGDSRIDPNAPADDDDDFDVEAWFDELDRNDPDFYNDAPVDKIDEGKK